jgi:hypothetical protein
MSGAIRAVVVFWAIVGLLVSSRAVSTREARRAGQLPGCCAMGACPWGAGERGSRAFRALVAQRTLVGSGGVRSSWAEVAARAKARRGGQAIRVAVGACGAGEAERAVRGALAGRVGAGRALSGAGGGSFAVMARGAEPEGVVVDCSTARGGRCRSGHADGRRRGERGREADVARGARLSDGREALARAHFPCSTGQTSALSRRSRVWLVGPRQALPRVDSSLRAVGALGAALSAGRLHRGAVSP